MRPAPPSSSSSLLPSLSFLSRLMLSQAIKYTGEALLISPTSAKALFRRAAAYEAKKEFEKALEDLKVAASHTPTEDKAITKSIDRIKKAIQKEKDKEKKMWGKAFSG
jgi:tetratricopeptide (TPR) repeat protein